MENTKINYMDDDVTNDIYNIISKESFNYLSEALLEKFNIIYEGEIRSNDIHFVEKIGYYTNENVNKNGYNNILSSDSRIIIIGDIHSSFHSLLHVIETLDNRNFFEKNENGDTILKLKQNHYIFFLGDMIDRGPYNIEVLYLCFLLQYLNIDIVKNTRQVWLINGNHEDFKMNFPINNNNVFPMGYVNELIHQFKVPDVIVIYNKYYKVLHFLPSAIFLKFNEKTYQLNHGGIDITQIANIEDQYQYLHKILTDEIYFKYSINESSDFCFKWYDFDNNDDNDIWNNKTIRSFKELESMKRYDYFMKRVKISKKILISYLEKFNIETVISGHQDNTSIGIVERNNENNFENDKVYKDELKTLKENKNNEETNILVLDPVKNLLALTTSLATISKKVNKTIFLELYQPEKILDLESISNYDEAEDSYITKDSIIYIINPNYSNTLYKISYNDYLLIKDQIQKKYKL